MASGGMRVSNQRGGTTLPLEPQTGVVKKKSIAIEELIPFLFLIVTQIPCGIKMVSTSLLKFNQICFFFTTPDVTHF
ncbi:hypothetical protein PN36_25065 [Candidatus Thiomargarita nelsonii]|uniref:Uncharacterized protein n=1 Tax=Candidatus Thiomargarita nelsonii TaxID=1003181 RepID=A0A4E0R0I6_9GAMM|nr:hypothetical protein PN36_25065 [Candidatus Thiomargarita nelsonii]